MSRPDGYFGVSGRPYWNGPYGAPLTTDPRPDVRPLREVLNNSRRKKVPTTTRNAIDKATIKLTDSRMTSPHGTVHFILTQMPGCCGVSVISSMDFSPKGKGKEGLHELYKDFNWALRYKYNDEYRWRVAKLLATDIQDGSIFDFCSWADWWTSEPKKNPKTGHPIHIFEIERDAKQSNGNPGYRGGGVGRNWWQ